MTNAPAAERPRRRRWWIPAVVAGCIIILVVCAYLWQMFVLANFHEVVPGKVYRSGQPSEGQLKVWIEERHIRTVVNLRSQHAPEILIEVAMLEKMGVAYVSVELPVSHPPSGEELRRLIEVTEKAERPILFHCWRGSDRSALASCIAAMALGGETFDQARKQVSVFYGHFIPRGHDVTSVVSQYEKWCHEHGRPTGGWSEFRAWAFDVYGQGEAQHATPNDSAK